MKKEKQKDAGETPTAQSEEITVTKSNDSDDDYVSELREPRWSVVSFEQCAAKNLTYEEAAQKIAELEKQGVSGLCVVTDEAAKRIAAYEN